MRVTAHFSAAPLLWCAHCFIAGDRGCQAKSPNHKKSIRPSGQMLCRVSHSSRLTRFSPAELGRGFRDAHHLLDPTRQEHV